MFNLNRTFCLIALLLPLSFLAQCPDGESEIEFVVSTDAWGYELYWELVPGGNGCGEDPIEIFGNDTQVGCEGGGEQDATGGNGYASNSTITEDPICLTDEETYTIHFVDDWGDGGLYMEIYEEGLLTYIFTGTGNGNVWDFTVGSTNIPEYDFPCIAYDAEVGESGILITNVEATVSPGEPAPPGGSCAQYGLWCEAGLSNTTWVSFEAPESGSIQISSCSANTDMDTQLALWKVGDCNDFGSFTLITSNDDTQIGGCDGGNGFASDMFATCLNPGETYFIQCDGWAGAIGTYELRIEEVDDPPIELFAFVQNIPCAPDKGEEGDNSLTVILPGVDNELDGSWTGPDDFTSTDESLENLDSGTYTYTFTSTCGVEYEASWEMTAAPDPLLLSSEIEYPDCSESLDGSIVPNITGGTEPYEYSWFEGEMLDFLSEDESIEDIGVGFYSLFIEDANGCELSFSYTLNEEGVDFTLGNDTIICEDDAFLLVGPDDFEYEWQDGSTDQFFLFDASDFGVGVYPVVLNYSNDLGCDENAAIVISVEVCAGINEREMTANLVYPNPVDGTLFLSQNCEQCEFEIITASGQVVMQGPVFSSGIEVQDLSAGIYMFKLIDENQNSQWTRILVR